MAGSGGKTYAAAQHVLLYEGTVRRHIIPFLGRKQLGALRRADIDEWIRDRERAGLAPSTVYRLWAVLHSGLEHAVRTERLAVNPANRPSLPRVEKQEPRTLPREHVRKVLESLDGEPDAALYALELTTGLREGELLGLRWAHDETMPGVDLKRALLKRLGLPDYKFHELRHTAASLALSEGASLFHVSRMLGHSSISITADTYGHWTDEGREDVAMRLERALLGSTAKAAPTR